jgi:hypothetical protein
MTRFLSLILLSLLPQLGQAQVLSTEIQNAVPSLLGTTIQVLAGDISSGGDEQTGGEEPDIEKLIMSKISSDTLFNCMIQKKGYSIEYSKIFSPWSNRGAVRMMRPGEAGGGITFFLEKYDQAVEIDPTTNITTLRTNAQSVDASGVVVSHLILEIQVGIRNNKLEIIAADYFYNSPDENLFGSMDKKEITCQWGKLTTGWD